MYRQRDKDILDLEDPGCILGMVEHKAERNWGLVDLNRASLLALDCQPLGIYIREKINFSLGFLLFLHLTQIFSNKDHQILWLWSLLKPLCMLNCSVLHRGTVMPSSFHEKMLKTSSTVVTQKAHLIEVSHLYRIGFKNPGLYSLSFF